MLLKDLDPFDSHDVLAKAGRRAEEQLAFYLRRAFAEHPDLHIINSLRLEHKGDFAQIDHLLLHRGGMVIVESKSVTTQVAFNEHGEWTRLVHGRLQGMPSPVLQAERQADFLKRYLDYHAESILGKRLGFQAQFSSLPIATVVAISDSGLIVRSSVSLPASVCKADQATSQIRQIVQDQKKSTGLLAVLIKARPAFSLAEFQRIGAFLVQQHCPFHTPKPAVTPAPTLKSLAAPSPFACRHCKSAALSVLYGRYGYYFQCADCEGNTPIKLVCPACRGNAKVRKAGETFFADCPACRTSELFFTHAEPLRLSA